MKKYFLIMLFIISVFCGCSKSSSTPTTTPTITPTETESEKNPRMGTARMGETRFQ